MKRILGCLFVAGVLVTMVAFTLSRKPEVSYYDDKLLVQQIDCANNMRQIGQALGLWASTHGKQYPFNVSTNDGGSREFGAVDSDGFASDPSAHFRTLVNEGELSTPRLLICPHDQNKRPAIAFDKLESANVTYRLRIGTNLNERNPQEVLMVCPIDGNVLLCSEKVVEAAPSDRNRTNRLMRAP